MADQNEQRIRTTRLIFEGEDPLDKGFLGVQRAIEDQNDRLREQNDYLKRHNAWERDHYSQRSFGMSRGFMGQGDFSFTRNDRRMARPSHLFNTVRIDNALSDIIYPLEERLEVLQDESASRRERFDVEHFLYYERFLSLLNTIKGEEETRKGIFIRLQELNRKPFWTIGVGLLKTIDFSLRGILKVVQTLWKGIGFIWKGLFGAGDRRTTEEKILQVNKDQLDLMLRGETQSRYGTGFARIFNLIREQGLIGAGVRGLFTGVAQRREDARARGENVKPNEGFDQAFADRITRRRTSPDLMGVPERENRSLFSSLKFYMGRIKDGIMDVRPSRRSDDKATIMSLSKVQIEEIKDTIDASNDNVVDELRDASGSISSMNRNSMKQHQERMNLSAKERAERKWNASKIEKDDDEKHQESVTVLDSINKSNKEQDSILGKMRRTQIMQYMATLAFGTINSVLKLMNTTIGRILTIGASIWGLLKSGLLKRAFKSAMSAVWSGVTGTWKGIKDILKNSYNTLKRLPEKIGNYLKSLIPGYDKVKSVGRKVRSIGGTVSRVGRVFNPAMAGVAGMTPKMISENSDLSGRSDNEIRDRYSRGASILSQQSGDPNAGFRLPRRRLDPTQTIERPISESDLRSFAEPVERPNHSRITLPVEQQVPQAQDTGPRIEPYNNKLLEEIRNILNIMKDQYDPMPGGFDRNTQLNLLGE